jgi:hypothetical protein
MLVCVVHWHGTSCNGTYAPIRALAHLVKNVMGTVKAYASKKSRVIMWHRRQRWPSGCTSRGHQLAAKYTVKQPAWSSIAGHY